MKIDCTSNNGGPCLNCEAFMAGWEAGARSRDCPAGRLTMTCVREEAPMLGDTMTVERLCAERDAAHARIAMLEAELEDERGVNRTELRRAVATFARLRNLCGEAADMLDSMPWRSGAYDLRERLLEAVANK